MIIFKYILHNSRCEKLFGLLLPKGKNVQFYNHRIIVLPREHILIHIHTIINYINLGNICKQDK